MNDIKVFKPNYRDAEKARIPNMDMYKKMYDYSVKDPEGFWAEQAERLDWYKKWDKVADNDLTKAQIKWFEGGKLNVSYNCLDRHIKAGHGDQTALIWEGNDPNTDTALSYSELLSEVSKFANILKSKGVEKGDRVCIYMQMIPELAIAMLACTRIGAVHSIVFGAFSPDALRDRINDSSCKVLITQDTGVRGTKQNIPMKSNADKALEETPSIEYVFVVQRTGEEVTMQEGRDFWWEELMETADDTCTPVEMDAEDPLFILYTSGSTGKPKGVLHTTGGYLVYAAFTHETVFDYQPGDIYWCTADIGWITGHSYIIYGPLANRATTLMFEGVPNYPDFGRFWDVVEKHKVNIFYTAPTALRALMREGNDFVLGRDRSSIKLLGTVGEPIKEPEWMWYYDVVGDKRCPVVDTWWQTETGGILITPLPAVTETKPGSATLPFFGITPVILDPDGNELHGNPAEGLLAIKTSWPGQMRTIYGDHERFYDTYFSMFKGYYFTGDGARRDEDGYYWITGRVDDVLNVSGHRLGTAEIEGAIGAHPSVAEAAVVGYPHDIKGQGVYAYVTLMAGVEADDNTFSEIKMKVRELIGPHASPDKIQFTPALPKTRSGKIMRRILRKIAEGDTANLGDTSTLADPGVVDDLVAGMQ
ncbi:MAG TPA: acetate--CoA ligase [Candidatus Marinimicrobia bacterium]|jgi:acetyl-CoA synthetase|nr:acetate--CoA ligase [Candidatus Neomarinimicrobiota bacterium]MDP6143387.1 acetate--CoA ligase [Candidatus Neomarinimicrobiota bacterium]MDP6261589.1 acetate--CoA ligase [Candidatus Neomarinimicrobiota bacterium]MDP7127913.1 acetate--CoA ligase [Candidatus Neomarinimicrobiota bacterium]MDP7336337.1 acetate--CoA ligase [Candidatus Neomarinimicrobiota bacterium]